MKLAIIFLVAAILFIAYNLFSPQKKKINGTLYYFRHPQCGYCRSFDPTWNSLRESDYAGIKFVKVDVTNPSNRDIVFYYDIDRYPTIIFSPEKGKHTTYRGDNTREGVEYFISNLPS